MAFRWLQLTLIFMITVTFFLYIRRTSDIQLKDLKPFDPRVFVQPHTDSLLARSKDRTNECGPTTPLELNSAFYLPSRHQLLRFQAPISAKTKDVIDDQDFCPPPGPGRRTTAILVPIGQGLEPWQSEDSRSRTSFLGPSQGGTKAEQSEIGFLPFHSQTSDERRLSRPPRLRTNMTDKLPCPVYYVPASPSFAEIPPLKKSTGGSKISFKPLVTAFNRFKRLHDDFSRSTFFGSQCDFIRYSEKELNLWHRRGYSEFMFGFATTPSRALDFIPRWSEWLPSSFPPIGVQPGDRWKESVILPLRRITASAIVLIPPREELDQAWEVESAARGAGLDIKLKELEADRFERRYMSLVQEMWKEALQREKLGGPITQWFTLADDDTYFLSLDPVVRMLAKYDPLESHFVGGQSESENARRAFGNIAFGGAGIFLSRGLMKQINEPGAFESCVSLFAKEFGGDGMITKCAAMMMRRDVQEVVTKETTLHQMDIRDEGHGIFQAGWRFTSIHHWKSWFQLQPRAHPHTLKNPSTLASLLGSAARAVGPENWTRRYIWGMSETGGKPKNLKDNPSVMVSLGYSITVHGSGFLQPQDLDKIEMTFASNKLTSETRPALLETKQRRTYYLFDLQTGFSRPKDLNRHPDVAVMSHINHEGDVIDLVWDARPRSYKK